MIGSTETLIDSTAMRFSSRTNKAIPLLCWCFAMTTSGVCDGQRSLPPTTEFDNTASRRDEYRSYAMEHDGDPQRGRAIFQDEKRVACSKCHSVDASHQSVGPDLYAIGDKFQRQDLISSILEPSKTIAVGFGTTSILTESGTIHQGILQRVTKDWLELRDKDSKPIRIPTDEIEGQQSDSLSIMPDGLELLVTVEEFSDLVAYLSNLRQDLQPELQKELSESIARSTTPVELTPAFAPSIRFDHPLWFGQIPGRPDAFVVLEQAGIAYVVTRGATGDTKDPLLDLSGTVRAQGATGLLGLAFHPRFDQNRRYFIKYQTEQSGRVDTIVEERRFADNQLINEEAFAPRTLLRITGSTPDHNGGCLVFGPDGYLYIGMGDSGPQRDPQGHGQDLGSLLGKILRIDVDQVDGMIPYAIPADNPLRDQPDKLPEIWAYGFREPWRFSFDSLDGELWVGDVGQDRFEEIAIVRAGENHGWNVYEGFAEHSDDFRSPKANYIPPILSYPRRLGVSVTGGHVYRGDEAPQLNGWYVFGDFESRRIWGLRQTDRTLAEVVEIGRAPTRIVSFSEDSNRDLYLVGFDDGIIYRMNVANVNLSPLHSKILADTSQQAGVQWRYTTTPPVKNWMQVDFDDSSWKEGPGGFGTVETPGARVRTDWNSNQIWLRRRFEVLSHELLTSRIRLLVHHDEDAVVYINGVEAATLTGWTSGYVEVPINEKAIASIHAGTNLISIHCRQHSGGQYIDAGLIEYTTSSHQPAEKP